jgi:hypothetical protein
MNSAGLGQLGLRCWGPLSARNGAQWCPSWPPRSSPEWLEYKDCRRRGSARGALGAPSVPSETVHLQGFLTEGTDSLFGHRHPCLCPGRAPKVLAEWGPRRPHQARADSSRQHGGDRAHYRRDPARQWRPRWRPRRPPIPHEHTDSGNRRHAWRPWRPCQCEQTSMVKPRTGSPATTLL